MRHLMTLSAAALLLFAMVAGGFGQAYGWARAGELSWEKRYGDEVDDWETKGPSVVTSSPVFDRGLRVAAMGLDTETRRVFALASAIFYFDVPKDARELKVKVKFEGESLEGTAGYLWVRDARQEVKEDGPLYGVTLALRAGRSSEVLYLTDLDRYINPDGIVEIHLVAEGDQQFDIGYIEIDSYSRPRDRVHLVERYEPIVVEHWPRYVYHYYYSGPVYFVDVEPFRYVVYTSWADPFSPVYVELRTRFVSFVRVHPIRHVHFFHRWPGRYYYRVGVSLWPSVEVYEISHVPVWTRTYVKIRREYLIAKRDPKTYEVRVRKPLNSITVSGAQKVKKLRDIRSDVPTVINAEKQIKGSSKVYKKTSVIREKLEPSTRSDHKIPISNKDAEKSAVTVSRKESSTVRKVLHPKDETVYSKVPSKDVRSSTGVTKSLQKRPVKADSEDKTSEKKSKIFSSKSLSNLKSVLKSGSYKEKSPQQKSRKGVTKPESKTQKSKVKRSKEKDEK